MIPFDFEYYRPNCIEEAIRLFHQLDKEGKSLFIMEEALKLLQWGVCNK